MMNNSKNNHTETQRHGERKGRKKEGLITLFNFNFVPLCLRVMNFGRNI